MAGKVVGNYGNKSGIFNRPQTPYTSEASLPRAIEQQAGDYDRIMQGYNTVFNSPHSPGGIDLMGEYRRLLNDARMLRPERMQYQETPEFNEAFANARMLAETGGLSDTEKGDLRARGISPIRAVYANAQRDMDRQRRISGGFSPNYNAAASRMSREMSDLISGATQNVNADIAEMVQRGKLTAAPIMAQLGDSSSGRLHDTNKFNANNANQFKMAGINNVAQILAEMNNSYGRNLDRQLNALSGMNSLYGTTPALVNTFGNQVAQNTGLQQNQRQDQTRRLLSGVRFG